MVVGNFLCSAAVAGIFWFTDLRARLGHARTANHRGRCLPDRISRPHIDRECVDPTSAVRLLGPLKILLSIYLSTWTCSNHVCWFGSALPSRMDGRGSKATCPGGDYSDAACTWCFSIGAWAPAHRPHEHLTTVSQGSSGVTPPHAFGLDQQHRNENCSG
jgi:hypothetical protein